MKVFIVSCLLLSVAYAEQAAPAEKTAFSDCFEKDSISCVQLAVFRRAREFFDQDNIDLVAGLSFAKNGERGAKSLNFEPEPQVEAAGSVEARENALEDYVVNRAKNFFQERSLSWNFASASRSLANAIPDEVKASVRSLIVEGRGKKKIIKKLLPLLGILKLKLAALAVLSIVGIALIAKKALLTSLVALAVSGSLALRKLFSGRGGGLGSALGGLGGGLSNGGGGWNGGVEEIIAYNTNGNGGGWSSGGGAGGWNSGYDSYGEHGSHSQPVAQTIAYSGHHKVARR